MTAIAKILLQWRTLRGRRAVGLCVWSSVIQCRRVLQRESARERRNKGKKEKGSGEDRMTTEAVLGRKIGSRKGAGVCC